MKQERWGLILALCVLLSLFMGCITERKVNHYIQDNKPYSDSLTADVLSKHPCDTVKVYQADTTYQHDTTTVTCRDTIGQFIHDTIKKTINNTLHIRDTAIVIDRRTVDVLTLKLKASNDKNTILTIQCSQKDLQILQEKNGKRSWIWWAIGTWILLFIAFLLWLYLQLKPKI